MDSDVVHGCPARGGDVVKTEDVPDPVCDLSTVLHELAHLAAPSYSNHELPWREIYVAAAAEALKVDAAMFEVDTTICELDAQVEAAIDAWLTTSGQRAVFKAIGVL